MYLHFSSAKVVSWGNLACRANFFLTSTLQCKNNSFKEEKILQNVRNFFKVGPIFILVYFITFFVSLINTFNYQKLYFVSFAMFIDLLVPIDLYPNFTLEVTCLVFTFTPKPTNYMLLQSCSLAAPTGGASGKV